MVEYEGAMEEGPKMVLSAMSLARLRVLRPLGVLNALRDFSVPHKI